MANGTMLHFDESRTAFQPYGLTCEIWEPFQMSRPDRHDEIEVNYLEKGKLHYLLGGRRITVTAGHWTMFWAALPHQIMSYEEVDAYFVVTIPLQLFLQWNVPGGLLQRLITGEVIYDRDGSPDGFDGARLRQWHYDLKDAAPVQQQIVQLELAARVLRAALHVEAAGNERSPADSGGVSQVSSETRGKAETMACYIAKNFRRRIRVADIAAEVELHVDYASTLFRTTFGSTLIGMITKHRVAESQRLLLTTDLPVLQIALESGFDSLSRFNRAFKEATGMTPRDFRRTNSWLPPKG